MILIKPKDVILIVVLLAALGCNKSFTNQMNRHTPRTRNNMILMDNNNNKKVMTYGADNFGDVMGGCETNMIVGGSFTPLERIVITANGNLQRIMSAYYGAPVIVSIIKCDPIKDIKSYITDRRIDTNNDDNLLCVYDREVSLLMNNQIFCIAKGMIEIYDKDLIDAIEYKKIGLGQMFRYLGALPSFKLHAAGRKQDGSLWRDYSLYITGRINCHFIEEFTTSLFDLKVD